MRIKFTTYLTPIVQLLVVICCSSSLWAQALYYVATGGNDTNPGTEQLPWKTIQKSCNVALPGSVVYIKEGVYNEKLTMNVSGDSINGYITFKNFGNDNVIVDGTGKSGEQMLLIENKNYIQVTGLEFRNNYDQSFGSGIWIQGYGDHIELRRNIIHDMKATPTGDDMGISVYGSNGVKALSHIVIDSNVIYNCSPGHSEALTLNGNVDSFQVTNNIVHDVNNIGIDMIGGEGTCPTSSKDMARNGVCRGNIVYNARSNYGGGYAAGIYVDGGVNILVERNMVYQCDVGMEIGCENAGRSATKMIVRNNILFNNDKRGLSFGGYNYPSTGKVTYSQFTNNTVFHNDVKNTDAGELVIEYAHDCIVKNNIFFATAQHKLMTTSFSNSLPRINSIDYNVWFTAGGVENVVIDYNGTIYNSFSAFQTATGQDAHSVVADPQFASTLLPNPDLHIISSSPAIDAGDPSFILGTGEADYDGNTRIQDSRVDAGSYEFIAGVAGAPAAPRNLIAVAGNAAITLSWRKNSETDFLRYRIYGGTFPFSTDVFDSSGSISDTIKSLVGLPNGISYYFRLTAVDSLMRESKYSNEVHIELVEKKYRTFRADTSLAHKALKMRRSGLHNVTLPNSTTAVEAEFVKFGKTGRTFLGIQQKDKTLIKKYAWVLYKSASDLEKLYTSPHTDNGLAYPFDSLRKDNGIGYKKLTNVIVPTRKKYDNIAFEQGVAFKLNLFASTDSILEPGLKGLALDTLFTLAGKQLYGMPLDSIALYFDSVMTYWNIYGVNNLSSRQNLYAFSKNILKRINDGFSAPLDTSNYRVNKTEIIVHKKPYAITLLGVKTAREVGIVKEVAEKENPMQWGGDISYDEHPTAIILEQNYPNPFNPKTVIRFLLSENSKVSLKVFNVLGEEVATLLNAETKEAGVHQVSFDANTRSSGVYFYQLNVVEGKNRVYSITRKMVLLR